MVPLGMDNRNKPVSLNRMDNTIKQLMNMPEPPEGFEYTGKIKLPSEITPWELTDPRCMCIILRKKRWRAEDLGMYWDIDRNGVPLEFTENGDCSDDASFDAFNYFQTKALAQQASELITKTLKEFHETI